MRTIPVHFPDYADPGEVMEALALALDFPEGFGCNLDALYDCLTDIGEETVLLCSGGEEPLWAGLRRVLEDAAAYNPRVHLADAETSLTEQNGGDTAD